MLVGEDRDSTVIVLAETAKTNTIKEYRGKKTGNGVIVLLDGADDCIISGLTVYNNYGTVVEPGNTTHQMAIFGRATRTIVINSNVFADGNDALSLWAPEAGGMYYHADLYLRCPGVDFLCPRGWCYATRCRFLGDSRAIIWHDGRGDKSKKLVIKDSYFDAKSPTILGRYHHDSQFFLLNCKLSSKILDTNISYAYTDKVLCVSIIITVRARVVTVAGLPTTSTSRRRHQRFMPSLLDGLSTSCGIQRQRFVNYGMCLAISNDSVATTRGDHRLRQDHLRHQCRMRG